MRTRNDVRVRVFAATMIAIGALGLVIAQPWSGLGGGHQIETSMPALANSVAQSANGEAGLDAEFLAAVAALQSGDYPLAVDALERFRNRAPHVPEVHVNLGFAYLGTGQTAAAEKAFQQALQLRPEQANAYYGLGLVYESSGNLELARGAMRTFIHLSDEGDPFLPKARAALWVWEDQPKAATDVP